ncbi:MlaD family protein [Nocardia sp. NBC_00511]|uniref:MlaD family protein n=1 Tax=Nocardia sp. NBC_00511 TaxID=2903591 RepID=UPI0030E284BC
MTSTRSLLLRLTLFASAMIVLLVGVFQTIARPVEGDTDTFTAVFTDMNGLKTGDDVRMYGASVGKIVDLRLAGATAEVEFTVQRAHPLFDNTVLAIRYQNLSGQRYLDVQQPTAPGNPCNPTQTIGTDRTVPSFDITRLFNGLQPVLAELAPADVNQFTTSLLAVIEGRGTGIGPALDAIEKLSRYTSDRQQVISTLIHNLAAVSDQIGGKSGNTIALLTQLTGLFQNLQEKIDGLVDFAVTIPPVLSPLEDLLAQFGLSGDPNPDLDNALRNAFPDPKQSIEVMNQLPALLQSFANLIPSTTSNLTPVCSRGVAPTPAPLRVLIGGQRITLCNH